MIYVLAYSGISRTSKTIKWFTFADKDDPSHVSLVNADTMEELESWHKGGVLPPHPINSLHTHGTRVRTYRINAPLDAQEKVWANARDFIGSGYDWLGIWSFVRRKARQNDLKVFCSELVDLCEKQADIVTINLPSYKITPLLCSAAPVHVLVAEYKVGQADLNEVFKGPILNRF